ncbi:MAG: aminopeptidase [Planctomycetaceae bacterium]|nr:aminopeptidase [Planctomycetaceae bacterium]
MDSRKDRLADVLVGHSCELKAGEKVLIEAFDLPCPELVSLLVKKVRDVGAIPVVELRNNRILRDLICSADVATLKAIAEIDAARMKQMDAYIGIRASDNNAEFSDVPAEKLEAYQQHYVQPVHFEIRVPETRWVVLRYPTASMAQSANMSTEAFEEFYYRVCTADYAAMEKAQQPLIERMLKANQVRIVSPGTDLSFSIQDIPVIPCNGRRNIPDGEVFTAPVRDSVNGEITYNIASRYQGTVFQNIRFVFRDGKIVEASCTGETERLNAILDTDEGARFIGEFSLGVNYEIQQPILDTLFDEKIGGSLHFTPGNAYTTADNGNRSAVHWDLILAQTPEFGGGEVWFDDVLIRKDGLFVVDDLAVLNPQYLGA